jgi:hypothetical protein
MANDFITPGHIAPEALRHLENELVLGNLVHTDYSKEFNKKGDTISIRRPTQFLGQENNLDVTSYREDIEQATIPLKLDQTLSIPVELSALDKTLSFDRFSEDIIKPAMIRMKDRIELAIAAQYYKFYHFAGTPGTIPATFKALGTPGSIMTDGAIPMSDRVAVHGVDASLELADGLKGVFVQEKAKSAFEEARIGRYAGFDNYTSVHAPTHTVGVATGTPLVNGASQGVTYAASKETWSQDLVTDGWTNSTTGILRAGDVITIAGVNAVNPVSKESTGRLQTFTVLANANSGASTGPATLSISPPIITSGPYQTVTAAPADNAAITVKTGTGGTGYKQSLLFHPKAIALVSRKLDIASSAGVKTASRTGNKVTVSVTEFVNGNTLAHTMRFDMLYAAAVIDPRLGARLTS